ncbi:unnamed protein product [Allacma fusca]|uniref:Uncharacterized protein n=1 Tax=Allacma fusca TaxID=39272 RepID=A0A8J2JDV2_9HEXA|nr:unnamed protein product [Allacma fusca]
MEMDITLEESVESRLANEVFHNPLIADEIWKRLNFEPVGYIFDHIRPYARIWKTSLDGTEEDGIETLNIWNLEFQTLNNL